MGISYTLYNPKMGARRAFGAWVATLFGLTCLAVLYMNVSNINPSANVSLAVILMSYSPALAALLVASLVPSTGGVGALFRQAAVWKVSIAWYALALAGPLLLVIAATLIYVVMGGTSDKWLALPPPEAMLALVAPLLAGAIGEELGWRGFGQYLLQKRYSVLFASVVIGFLWATWHSWPIMAPGGEVFAEPLPIAEGYVRLIATSIIYGWMYARTKSLLIVMLAHAGHTIAISVVPASLMTTTPLPIIIAGLYFVLAAVLVIAKPDLQKRA